MQGLIVLLCVLFLGGTCAEARDPSVIRQFRKDRPCPSKVDGKCSTQVDHIIPLKCGGADHLDNLQELTVAEHKAKTKRDWDMCIRKARNAPPPSSPLK